MPLLPSVTVVRVVPVPILATRATLPEGVDPFVAVTATLNVAELPAVVELTVRVVVVAVEFLPHAAAEVVNVPLDEYQPLTPVDGES